MGGSSPATSEQTSKLELPKWVTQAGQHNYELAKEICKKPYKAYGGPDIADQSNMTTAGYQYGMSNVDSTLPLMTNAAKLQGRTTELDPIYAKAQGVLAGTTGPWDPSQYLNPYTGEVEQRAISNANRNLTMSMNAAGDKARKAGAFGGSGAAIEQGVLASEGARTVGDLSAELRRAGYDKATADMLADRESKQKAAQGMTQGANDQQTGWQNAATGMLNTAGARQKDIAASTANMLGMGQQDQGYRQSLIEAKKARFNARRSADLEALNIRMAALGMSPYGQTQTTSGTSTPANPGTDWATVGLGVMNMLPMLSDERDKKDIKKLGKDPKTGLPLYAYRYKDAPASSPKVVGPMAQDVEKWNPSAVAEVGGHKVIKAGVLSIG